MIEEDMVQYKLFLIQPGSSSSQQTEERLTHLVEEILAKIAPLLIQYIWQHQPINLMYHPEKGRTFSAPQKGSSMLYVFTWLTLGTHTNGWRVWISFTGGIPAHIGGSTQFGDNVEDEWFIVYLLLQITEAFPELTAR